MFYWPVQELNYFPWKPAIQHGLDICTSIRVHFFKDKIHQLTWIILFTIPFSISRTSISTWAYIFLDLVNK